jgi:Cofactor assembly of complex C subunit B
MGIAPDSGCVIPVYSLLAMQSQSSILISVGSITVILSIGLFFFLRAAAKDRTQTTRLLSDRPDETLLEQLQSYFIQRSYRLIGGDPDRNVVTFEGMVRPSLFLAIFLSALAAIALFTLMIVLSSLYPGLQRFLVIPILVAPAVGLLYWRKAGRLEQVSLQIADLVDSQAQQSQRLLTVVGHRDELIELRQALGLEEFEGNLAE